VVKYSPGFQARIIGLEIGENRKGISAFTGIAGLI
jgi:hypothetical protein